MILRTKFSSLLTGVSTIAAVAIAPAQGDFEWSRQIGDFPGQPRFVRIHDFDGDGFADVLIGDPSDSTAGLDAGSLRVISGADGSALFRVDGDTGDRLGDSLLLIGDLNGDAIDEFVVATQTANAGEGAVFLYSGIDGSLMQRFDNPGGVPRFASSLSQVGDLDGDGFEDIGISFRPDFYLGLIFYSFARNKRIGAITGADYCSPLGDVDHDGQAEVIVAQDVFGITYRVVTAATGQEHWEYPWWQNVAGAGAVPDQNGNGTPDICFLNSILQILDGATGQVIFSGPNLGGASSGVLTPFPDIDGDGVDDLIGESWNRSRTDFYSYVTGQRFSSVFGFTGLIGSYPDDNGDGVTDLLMQSGSSGVEVISLLPGLALDPGTISASTQDTCYATIDFSSVRAGTRYVVLASECTFGERTWINDFPLPLGWSPFLGRTLAGTKIRGSTGFWGTLDADGDALATLTPGPRSHLLIGRELWMAVVLYEEWGSVPIGLHTSLPRRIQFVP